MNDHDDRQSVYEIGYLIATSVAEENVLAEADKVKKIITDAGASILTEENPHRVPLAYTMKRKTVAGSYDKYDEAYFGWVKFEAASGKVEALKKAVEVLPSILRMILITTVRENTYLGKRAPLIMARVAPALEEKKDVAPASIEEMDKSIDEMVKEV
jgi:ribosomal protein S6